MLDFKLSAEHEDLLAFLHEDMVQDLEGCGKLGIQL